MYRHKCALGVLAAVVLTLVTGCTEGRWNPEWRVLNPSCAPDGSVVFYEYPNSQGQYEGLKNSPQNCPWNKKAAAG